MAYIVTVCTVMVYIERPYIASCMAYITIYQYKAHIVTAYIAMAYIGTTPYSCGPLKL